MFAGWGSRVARLRWPVLIIALVAVIGSGVWGLGVFGQLTEGGYNDPRSESARAAELALQATGGQGGDVIAIYTPDKGAIDDAALTKRIKERLGALPDTAVKAQSSYWDKKSPAFAAKDKSSAVAVITLAGEDDAAKMDAYADIEDDLTVPGTRVELAGNIPLGHASSQRSTDDLAFAEMVSLPIVLILLLLIFGSLVAASLPVLVGGAAVLGSLGVLHAVALTHEVNSFAVNVASLLGLGMAIDYGLFMVGRFREEQAVHSTADAVRRTVATAGRTVVFSATLLMTALAGLLLFPQGFLKSLAYGGLAAVFLAMLLSLTLLPALLAVLGPRVDLIPIRLPGRAAGTAGWERLAGWVLRRPVLVAVPILAVLLVLALPITDARFGENDERQLPAGDPSRVAIETLKADYPQFASDGVQVVVHAVNGKKPDVKAFSAAAAKVTGVEKITVTGGNNKDTVIFTAELTSPDAFSDEARDTVDGLRALNPPAGTQLLVGGTTARNVDSLEAIGARLPLMIGLLVGATLILMFLAFGSVLLPIKAVVMSALSLSATFGSLVWIFQEGHGAELLDITPTPLEAGIVVLMASVVFGLSTDYEVFLLSRMVEARLRGSTTREAVTIGLSRTGRVISAAALLLIVVTGAFALSSITTMRFIGVGMIIALVLDATVVRVLLVPAVLAVLGDASWWAPGPLRRLQEKAGLAEHAGEPAEHVGEPAEHVGEPAEHVGEEEATGRHAWRPADPSLEETHVLDGTLLARALPAAPAQAALTSGSETSNTVVLDYDRVLDYLSEKNLSTGTPSDDPATGGVPLATSSSTARSDGSDGSPVRSGDSPDPAAADLSEAPAAGAADPSSVDAPGGPDDLWAEVEATLAAGAEVLKPDNEPSLIEAYTEAHPPDDFDPATTQVLHLPPADDPAATQVIRLPGSGLAPDEPVIFSETVYNGLFTEETVRAATPAPEPEPAEVVPSPDEDPADPASTDPDPASTSASTDADADRVIVGAVPDVSTLGEATGDPTAAVPTTEAPTGDSTPAQAGTGTPIAVETGRTRLEKSTTAEDDEVAYFLAPFTDDPAPATRSSESAPAPLSSEPAPDASVSEPTTRAVPTEPVEFATEPASAAPPTEPTPPVLSTEPASAALPEAAASTPVESAPHPYESAGITGTDKPLAAIADTAPGSPEDATQGATASDPFFWRADPRLTALTSPEPDSFPWLERYATLPDTPEPGQAAPHASPAPPETTPALPEATLPHPSALPHPLAEQHGSPRPQTLDDWLATTARTGPGQPGSSRTGEPTRAMTGAPPADRPEFPADRVPDRRGSNRPETLGDLPSTTAADRSRPASLADLTTRPATGRRPASSERASAEPASSELAPSEPASPEPASPEPASSEPVFEVPPAEDSAATSPAVAVAEEPGAAGSAAASAHLSGATGSSGSPEVTGESRTTADLESVTNGPGPDVRPSTESDARVVAQPDARAVAQPDVPVAPISTGLNGPVPAPAGPTMAEPTKHAEPVSATEPAGETETAGETESVGGEPGQPGAAIAVEPAVEPAAEVPAPMPDLEPADPAAHQAFSAAETAEAAEAETAEAGTTDPGTAALDPENTDPTDTDPTDTDPTNTGTSAADPNDTDTDRQHRPQTLDEWLSAPVPRPQTLEDLAAPGTGAPSLAGLLPPRSQESAGSGSQPASSSTAADPERNEPEFLRGRRPETLDDRLRGTVRPATLADHLPDHGRTAKRPANGGPSWTGGSGEHPYERQTRRPATLADHPGPLRPGADPVAEETAPDPDR